MGNNIAVELFFTAMKIVVLGAPVRLPLFTLIFPCLEIKDLYNTSTREFWNGSDAPQHDSAAPTKGVFSSH